MDFVVAAPAFPIDDRYDTVVELCESLDRIWNAPAGAAWELNLQNCGYLGPDAAALVYATYLNARISGRPGTVRLPDKPAALDAFNHFSGLKHLLHGGKRPNRDHPDCQTVPLNHFYQAVGNQADPILTLVRRHTTLSKDAEFYLGSSFAEVVQNIEDHAGSPIGGVSCARYFSGSNQVRVAVVDMGDGIANTLSRKLGRIDAVEALRLVVRGRVTSQSTERNQGLGISNLAGAVANTGGELMILSGLGAAQVSSKAREGEYTVLPIRFPGTGVFFKMNLDEHRWT